MVQFQSLFPKLVHFLFKFPAEVSRVIMAQLCPKEIVRK